MWTTARPVCVLRFRVPVFGSCVTQRKQTNRRNTSWNNAIVFLLESWVAAYLSSGAKTCSIVFKTIKQTEEVLRQSSDAKFLPTLFSFFKILKQPHSSECVNSWVLRLHALCIEKKSTRSAAALPCSVLLSNRSGCASCARAADSFSAVI